MIERFEKFTRNIAVAGKCIAKIKANEMRRFGLRGGCVMCLFFIGQHPEGLTSAELCELCNEDKAGISRTLSRLRSRKYIKILEEGKKYRVKYYITPSGQDVCNSVREAINRSVFGAGSELTEDERDIFYRAFDSINSNLLAICDAMEEE